MRQPSLFTGAGVRSVTHRPHTFHWRFGVVAAAAAGAVVAAQAVAKQDEVVVAEEVEEEVVVAEQDALDHRGTVGISLAPHTLHCQGLEVRQTSLSASFPAAG
jgi:hypothetical protein